MAAAKQAHVFQRMVPRAALRPGQAFWYRFDLGVDTPVGRALVVIDRTTEVDFWTGAVFCVGDVEPFMQVEVL